jgi:hypothetical protein
MDIKIQKQCERILTGHRGTRTKCQLTGMIVDIKDDRSYYQGTAIEKGAKDSLVWNACNYCVAGYSMNSYLNKHFSDMKAILSPNMYKHVAHGGSQYFTAVTDEERLRFFDILLNHTPYGKIIHVKSAEWACKHGIIVDTDAPRNLVIATLMAQRLAWENTRVLTSMLRYVDLGVNKTVAFMLAFTYDIDGDKNNKDWHVPLNGGKLSMGTLARFVEGDCVGEDTMRECMYYSSSVHASWGDGNDGGDLASAISLHCADAVVDIPNPFAKTLEIVQQATSAEGIASYFKQPHILNELGIYHE